MTDNPDSLPLYSAKCLPCEGGVDRLTLEQSQKYLQMLTGWEILTEPDRIRKSWVVRDFVAGLAFLNAVAEVSEIERHHPDLHLSGYRNISVEIWTHAIGGLSVNDFVLAAKIDQLPIHLKK